MNTSLAPARSVRLIVIGGSAGSLDVLRSILPSRRGPLCPPIACVVHLPAGGPALLHHLLNTGTGLIMKQAEDKEPLLAGHVYFAPPDYHVLIERDLTLALSVDAPLHYSRPAIDVLFDTAAHACGAQLLAVLLTGASADGAAGIASVAEHSGLTAVQTPESSYASTMPESALRRLPAPTYLLPPAGLGTLLASIDHMPVA